MSISKIFERIKSAFRLDTEIDQYFPGCLTELKVPQLMHNYLEICKILNIKVELLDLICCGLPAINAGHSDEFLQERRKAQIAENKVRTIYSSCPSCVFYLKERNYNSELILNAIYPKLQSLKKKQLGLKVTFHDPCHMGRYLHEYDLPRNILREIGCEVVEMRHSRENSLCCGAGGGLINNDLKLARKIAEERIKEAKEVSDILVTACPLCYLHLKSVSDDVKVLEISELMLSSIK
ncbi:MAG: (Fe-S)-binding protein [Candidatus Woesearchaeota archaeon]